MQKPLTPQWETIKTFGPEAADRLPAAVRAAGTERGRHAHPGRPPTSTTSWRDTSNLSDTQKVMAEYWADGPNSEFPPGHMALFAQAFSRMKGDTADQDVKLFFALGNALMDASIFAWTTKYQYDSERPTTGIRERYTGQDDHVLARPQQGLRQGARPELAAVPGAQRRHARRSPSTSPGTARSAPPAAR